MTQVDETRSYEIGSIFKKSRRRTWPVTAVSLLLLLQAVGLFGLGAIHFAAVHLLEPLGQMLELSAEEQLLGMIKGIVMSMIFIPLSLLAILATIGFLRLWRNAWTNAMLLQGLTLFIALLLYFGGKPFYVYILMLYSIFMVLYLNYHDVRMAFRPKPVVEDREEAYQGDEGCGGNR